MTAHDGRDPLPVCAAEDRWSEIVLHDAPEHTATHPIVCIHEQRSRIGYHQDVATEELNALSGTELVELADAQTGSWKDIGAVLDGRDADPRAADVLIAAHRSGRLPPWLVAYLLGCVRAPQGYDVAREVLLAAPGLLAESYAGPAMARIAGAAAYDDLVSLMMGAAHLRSREGAAYGLGVLERPGTAAVMLEAAQTRRVRRKTAAAIVAKLPTAASTVLEWFASDDDLVEAMALDAAHSLLMATNATADVALAWAIRRCLDGGRVKQSPRMRQALERRIAPVIRGRAGQAPA